MRHLNKGRKFNRNSSHRKAMFRNMCVSLFEHEQIRTTLPKAKELRVHAEPLITLAKNDNVAKRRQAFAALRSDAIVAKLFTELGPKFQDRPGGYIRILKCGFRAGDKAPMAIVELIQDPCPPQPVKKKPAKKASTDAKPSVNGDDQPDQTETIPADAEKLKHQDVCHPDVDNIAEMEEVVPVENPAESHEGEPVVESTDKQPSDAKHSKSEKSQN